MSNDRLLADLRDARFIGQVGMRTQAAEEIERLTALVGDMLALLDDMPVKHPQQAERREDLRKRLGIHQQLIPHSEEDI